VNAREYINRLSGIIPMATVVATDVIQTLKKTEIIK
jgi:hypothetical protein